MAIARSSLHIWVGILQSDALKITARPSHEQRGPSKFLASDGVKLRGSIDDEAAIWLCRYGGQVNAHVLRRYVVCDFSRQNLNGHL